jgi:hypothetical protein
MKRAGKIGRYGRAAIVAALGAAFVLLAIPAANAGQDSSDNQPTKIVRQVPSDEGDVGILVEWE